MKLPVGRQRLVLFAVLGLVLAVGVGAPVFWQVAKKDNQTAQKDAPLNDYLKIKAQEAGKKISDINTAKKKEYDSLAGIASVSQFEAKFPADQREGKALLTLKRMVDDAKYSEALEFATYIEKTYPKLTTNIDFAFRAYKAAKATNKQDLMEKYKKNAETILRTNGSLGPNEKIRDDYFSGGEEVE